MELQTRTISTDTNSQILADMSLLPWLSGTLWHDHQGQSPNSCSHSLGNEQHGASQAHPVLVPVGDSLVQDSSDTWGSQILENAEGTPTDSPCRRCDHMYWRALLSKVLGKLSIEDGW
jgi:hypothetical protein